MKNYLFFIFSLCILASYVGCQEEDSGFTTEDVRASVYEREFIKTFGKPATGHQWGFDSEPFYYEESKDSSTNSLEKGGAETRSVSVVSDESHVKKTTMVWRNNKQVWQAFELPNAITPKEHEEVYNWFSNHKVNWEKTPTNCEDPDSRKCVDNNEVAKEINKDFDYGSLSAYKGDAAIFTEFELNWAWIQHVASDRNKDEHYIEGGEEKVHNGAQGTNMNHLCFQIEGESKYAHLYDFNGGEGKGYGNSENAILVYDCNFDDCIFQSTVDGNHYFNKYIIKYLKGDGYEGWYLGMDIEGDGINASERVYANGICNDWIVKLTIPTSKINTGQAVRIMCEDLGGVYDYDFNDVVIDVTPRKTILTQKTYLEVELKALGGTLPVYVAYNGTPLWGTEDLHKQYNSKSVDAVGKPVNVSKDKIDNAGNEAITSTKEIKKYIVPKDFGSDLANFFGAGYIQTTEDLKYSSIQIFIKPDSEAQWIQLANYAGTTPLKICVPQTVKWAIECAAMPGTKTAAKSTNAEYHDAGRSIGSAYPSFMDWVRDPSVEFWNKTKNTEYLMP